MVKGSPHFNTTRWSLIERIGQDDLPAAQLALDELASLYWYPLYAYLRRSGENADDAADLVQGLFLKLLDSEGLTRIEESGGRFRNWVLTALKNHAIHVAQSARAEKRGGGRLTLSLDLSQGEDRYRHSKPGDAPPEKMLLREWAQALLDAAKLRLGGEYSNHRRSALFNNLKGHLVQPLGGETIKEKVLVLGMTENSVEVALYRLRRRYGQILRELVGATLNSEDDIDEEINQLLEALSEE